MSEAKPVSFYILDKQYQVACREEDREALLESVHYLDTRMREIRDAGKVVGSERIAVMAALNMAHELIHQKSGPGASEEVSERLRSVSDRINKALGNSAT